MLSALLNFILPMFWVMSKYKFNLFHKSSGYQKTTKQTFVGLENVSKKSSRHALKISSTPLQSNNFTSCKTSWRPLRRQKVVTLKTSSRCLQDLSWRCLKEMSWKHALKMSKYFLGISVWNKSKCVSNKSIFHKAVFNISKTNPKWIN